MAVSSSTAPNPPADHSYRGFGIRVVVAAAATGGALSVIEHSLEPGFIPMPLHRHARETETTYVLSGTLTVQLGDDVRVLRTGASIVKPPGVRHGFWNQGDETAHFLEIVTPGGIEEFYREIADRIPRGAPADVDAVLAASTRYGLEFDTESLLDIVERYGVHLV